MSPKGYTLIFTSHSSAVSHLDLSKDNLGLHVGESVCDNYQNFTVSAIAVAMKHGDNRIL